MKLGSIKKLVYDIMYEDERARKDDPYLIWRVCTNKYPKTKYMGFTCLLTNYHLFDLPPFESITRFSRDFRRENKELIDLETKMARNENMKEYKTFFKR